MYKVYPLITKDFNKSGEFKTKLCATFEMQNTGQTTIHIDGIYKISPTEKLHFPPLGNCVVYDGVIPFEFDSEEGKTNKLTVISTVYETSH